MTVLLDTHTLIWASLASQSLSRAAAAVIADPANINLVSAATAWEMSTKVRLGKLPEAVSLEANLISAIHDAGYGLLAIDAETALRAARLGGAHRDPFDRMLAAHALALDIPIVSTDPKLDQFGIRRIW